MTTHYRGPVVVLARIADDPTPEHCIHGRVECVRCHEWCWLGDQTLTVVTSGEALPLCHQCAVQVIPPDQRAYKTVADRPAADGPH